MNLYPVMMKMWLRREKKFEAKKVDDWIKIGSVNSLVNSYLHCNLCRVLSDMFGLTSGHSVRGETIIRLKKLSSPVMALPNLGYPLNHFSAGGQTEITGSGPKKPFSYLELLDYCDHSRVHTPTQSPTPTPYVRKFEFSTEDSSLSPKFDIIPFDQDLSEFGNQSLAWSGRLTPREHRVAMIQSWLSRCEREHGYKCGHYPHTAETTYQDNTLLVVDVQRGYLTEITPSRSQRYFALSYVWGRQETFQTLKKNVKRLRQPGSISYSSAMLPKTIRDAIKLLIALNERYLWCDRLCIIQDDAESKHSSISRMNTIFGAAHAVIMARSGFDAEAGLLSQDRLHPWQRVIRLSEGMRFVTVPSSRAEEGAGLAPLEGRGWAYQEKVLAWRTLTFNHGLISFQCCQALWREDVNLEEVPYTRLDEATRRRISETYGGSAMLRELSQVYLFPKDISTFLALYSICLQDYSKRTLTYQSDALSAFEGILQTLASWSKSTFHVGLPRHKMLFFITMLWETGQPHDTLRGSGHPTWSWVAWKGTIITHFEELHAGLLESWVVWFEDSYDSVEPFHDGKDQVGMPGDIHTLCGNVEVVEYPFRNLGLEAPLTLGTLRFYTLCAAFEVYVGDPAELSTVPSGSFAYLRDKYRIPCGTLGWNNGAGSSGDRFPTSLKGRQSFIVIARGSPPISENTRHMREDNYIKKVQHTTGRTPRHYEYEYPQLFAAIIVDWVDGVAYRKCPQIAWIVPAAFTAALEPPQWGRVVLR